jgi:hypothetical protein
MTWTSRRSAAGVGAVTLSLAAAFTLSATTPSSAAPVPAARPAPVTSGALPLGPRDLVETRTTRTLQRGVTLTTIERGVRDAGEVWTVEVSIPAGATSPDPDAPPAALSDRADADALAVRLRAAGFDPRVERVTTPPAADYDGGVLGWRVRLGRFADQAGADALRTRLVAAGFAGTSRYTGWDGEPAANGPWHLQVLTVDPRTFRGRLVSSIGPDVEQRETTSALARAAGATAATNAGYFVLDPAAGAPGDPAGVGVYGGRLLSETVGRRPALVLDASARRTEVERLRWVGLAEGVGRTRLVLDGLDRVPGLIRNCGGPGDVPTTKPLHDVTCTDPDELVAFTPQFGASTPAGPGLEAVVGRDQRVVALRTTRGVTLRPGQRSVQATGSDVAELRAAAKVGRRLTISTRLRDGDGTVRLRRSTSVVNGGPELVRDGRVHVTPQVDGFVRPTEPSFYYGFSASRNPRTFAGVDARGRTVIATADGRSSASVGLTILETGAVARALGLRDALNLDGGGSTTMVVDGQVTNVPSDAAGERPVGDALLVLPRRSGR